MITRLWLSGHEDLFLYSSSVYSCHLFLISSASVRSILFLSFIVTIFFFLSVYLFLAVLGLHWCLDSSLVVVSRGFSLVVVHEFLTAVASLEEHRLLGD